MSRGGRPSGGRGRCTTDLAEAARAALAATGKRERRERPGPQRGAKESRDRETWCFFTGTDKRRSMSKAPELETDTKSTDSTRGRRK